TPLLFQGQEYGSETPFLYFADHKPDLAKLVATGRQAFLGHFASLADPKIQDVLPLPHDPNTFTACKLDRTHETPTLALYCDLLRLRKTDPTFSRQGEYGLDGAVLAEHAFALRFFGTCAKEDRLLLVNLGADLALSPAEPLLAPPENCQFRRVLS